MGGEAEEEDRHGDRGYSGGGEVAVAMGKKGRHRRDGGMQGMQGPAGLGRMIEARLSRQHSGYY